MKEIEILNWPFAGSLTVGDEPIETRGALRVYELVSAYEYIEKRVDGIFKGRYNHVAADGRDLFIFDVASHETAGRFGPYRAYTVASNGKLSETTL